MSNQLQMLAERCGHPALAARGLSLRRTRHIAAINHRQLRKLRRLVAAARQDTGFTLVEVIVALAILSLGLSVLLGQMSGGLQQVASAEKMAEAGSLAQSLLAEVGNDLPIKLEERAGQFPNGYRWRLKMLPYGGAKEREEWPIGIYMVVAEVEWDEGAQRRAYALTTLRLGPKAARQ